MNRRGPLRVRRPKAIFLVFLFAALFGAKRAEGFQGGGAPGQYPEVPPDATPRIERIAPDHAAPGEEVSVEIEGGNFSKGVYVSFSTPAFHVLSLHRRDTSHLEARIAVDGKAQPGTVSLYVSNPASAVAEMRFTILAGAGSPAAPASPATAAPVATAPVSAPSTQPAAKVEPSEAATPEVTAVEPAEVTPLSDVDIKVTGKKFMTGAKVAFANPAILVLETRVIKPTELVAHVQVASDASTGRTSLFVVNPDESEVEVAFEVVEGRPVRTATSLPSSPSSLPAAEPSTSTTKSATPAARVEVYNLGEALSVLQTPMKTKGVLSVANGKLRYEEEGKAIFSAPASDVQEIGPNIFLGMNTGTFHVILKSGKNFNFIGASLRPADTQAIVDSLLKALH